MFLPHMVWKHLPQNRWFNQHLMYSFTSLTVIKKKKKSNTVDFSCGARLWSWRPAYNAEKPMAYQRLRAKGKSCLMKVKSTQGCSLCGVCWRYNLKQMTDWIFEQWLCNSTEWEEVLTLESELQVCIQKVLWLHYGIVYGTSTVEMWDSCNWEFMR